MPVQTKLNKSLVERRTVHRLGIRPRAINIKNQRMQHAKFPLKEA